MLGNKNVGATIAVRDLAAAVFANTTIARRADVVAKYQDVLKLTGSLEAGRGVFEKTCAACHQLEGKGTQIGADLNSVRDKGREAVMLNILDPNREAQPNFTAYTVVTTSGTLHTGIIAAETATSITLRRAEGKEDVILRSNIDALTSSGQSLMPVGLEKEITSPEMADLLAFMKSVRPETKKP